MFRLNKSGFLSVAILCMVIVVLYWLMTQDKSLTKDMSITKKPLGQYEAFKQTTEEVNATSNNLGNTDSIEMLSMNSPKQVDAGSAREELLQKQAQMLLDKEERLKREADDRIGSDEEEGKIVPNPEENK